MDQHRPLLEAIYRLYETSGFAMAGAVAFSLIVSLFPFCIFLGALASVLGGRELATVAVDQLFAVMPKGVAEALAPQVQQIMGESRTGLLTISGLLALFFATTANETLRTALNGAYRVTETRPYLECLGLSTLFVFLSALAMLIVTWVLVVGPNIVQLVKVPMLDSLLQSGWHASAIRYLLAAVAFGVYLVMLHLWLAAGSRTLGDVWPGILLSIVLMLALAGLYSRYLQFSDYTQFYAGLSQIMVALIFFQAVGVIILLGAELNRGIIELPRLRQGA